MKNIKRTSEIVLQVLKTVPETRNSDDLLYIEVCKMIDERLAYIPLASAFRNRKLYGLPPFESVRRTRQKIQQQFPELQGNKEVKAQRAAAEEAVREYVRE